MTNLFKEMEEYKQLLEDQAKDIVERMERLNVTEQNKDVLLFTQMLTYDHISVNLRITLIDKDIMKYKDEVLEKVEA